MSTTSAARDPGRRRGAAPGQRARITGRAWASPLRNAAVSFCLVGVAGLVGSVAGLVAPWVIGWLVDVLPDAEDGAVVLVGAGAIAVANVVGAVYVGWTFRARAADRADGGPAARDGDGPVAATRAAQMERTETGDLVSRVAEDARDQPGRHHAIPLAAVAVHGRLRRGAGRRLAARAGGAGGTTHVLDDAAGTCRGPVRSHAEERAAFGTRGQPSPRRDLRFADPARLPRQGLRARTDHRRLGAGPDLSIRVFYFVTRAFSRNNRAEATVLALLLVVGFFLRMGMITAGAVTTAALLFHRLFNPIGALVWMADQVQSAGASLVRMVGVITMPVPSGPPFRSPARWHCPESHVPALAGSTPAALLDIDSLAPGEVVAVVGSTGAGGEHAAAGRRRLGGAAPRRRQPGWGADCRCRPGIAARAHHDGLAVRCTPSPRPWPRTCGRPAPRPATTTRAPPCGPSAPTGGRPAWTDRHPGRRRRAPAQSDAGPDDRPGPRGACRPGRGDPRRKPRRGRLAGARRLDTAAAAVLKGRAGLVVAHRLARRSPPTASW